MDTQDKTKKASAPETRTVEATMLERVISESGYTIKNNVVQDLGKFEGEHVMSLYFYDAMMNGDGDPIGDDNDLKFNVTDAEAELFNIEKGSRVTLHESDQGFVTTWIN